MYSKILLALAAASGIVLSAPASAEIKWQTDVSGGCSGSSYGNSCNFSSGGVTATATAWSNTSGTSNNQLNTAYLGVYSGGGLGVKNRDACTGTSCTGQDLNENDSPEHGLDNNQRFDSILFTFSSNVVLSKAEIGYRSLDSDISVLAYVGVGAPVMLGKTYAELQASSDWIKVGNYANLATGSPKAVNAGQSSSSYWLIGAYNSTFGTGAGLDTGNDHVKLLALYGDKPTPPKVVPLPSSLLLIGAGFLGFLRIRRS